MKNSIEVTQIMSGKMKKACLTYSTFSRYGLLQGQNSNSPKTLKTFGKCNDLIVQPPSNGYQILDPNYGATI
jgi:hypothetical protein